MQAELARRILGKIGANPIQIEKLVGNRGEVSDESVVRLVEILSLDPAKDFERMVPSRMDSVTFSEAAQEIRNARFHPSGVWMAQVCDEVSRMRRQQEEAEQG